MAAPTITVKITRKLVETGPHRGTKGQQLTVPEDVGRHWIALKAAVEVKAGK